MKSPETGEPGLGGGGSRACDGWKEKNPNIINRCPLENTASPPGTSGHAVCGLELSRPYKLLKPTR